jgi:hypothetical protein
LEIEINADKESVEETFAKSHFGNAMITPRMGEGYWVARIRLHEDQYVQAFPKFFTLGIGFAKEEDDWNTNLPYTCGAEEIASHIWKNRKYDVISKDNLIRAIELLQEACRGIIDLLFVSIETKSKQKA